MRTPELAETRTLRTASATERTSIGLEGRTFAHNPMVQLQVADAWMAVEGVRGQLEHLAADWVGGNNIGADWLARIAAAKHRTAVETRRAVDVFAQILGEFLDPEQGRVRPSLARLPGHRVPPAARRPGPRARRQERPGHRPDRTEVVSAMSASYLAATDLLTIEATCCGPPESAHGGVAVGRFAQLVDPGPVELRLDGPPPLATPMTSRTDADGTVVVSGPGGDVATVRPLAEPIDIDPFDLAPPGDVERAEAGFLAMVTEKGHGFPTCFACGTDRHDPDALRQFGGQASDGDLVARFHVPGASPLPDWLTLAGLDCPSGHVIFGLADPAPELAVLGSMRCQVNEGARAGLVYQVRGRLASVDGRKYTSEVAMLAPDGTAVAQAVATWISIDRTSFGAAAR